MDMLDAEKIPAGSILKLTEDLGSECPVLPADTSDTCTRLRDQEGGVVLCEGRVRQVPL